MRKLGALVVISASFLSVVAGAAPNAPGPAVSVKRAPGAAPSGVLKAKTVEWSVPQTLDPNRCGQAGKAQILIRNYRSAPWSGYATFGANGTSTTTSISLAPDEAKVVPLTGGVLDCNKPLAPQTVGVFSGTLQSSTSLGSAVIAAHEVTGRHDFGGPLLAELRLRSVSTTARCGQKGKATAVVYKPSNLTNLAPLQLTLDYGGASSVTNVTSEVAQASGPSGVLVHLDSDEPVRCDTGTGLFALHYSTKGTTSTLAVGEVAYKVQR